MLWLLARLHSGEADTWHLAAVTLTKTPLAEGNSLPVLGPSQRRVVAPFDLCCLFV